MSMDRPIEQCQIISVTASAPTSPSPVTPQDPTADAGNATILCKGAGVIHYEVTAVNGLTGTLEGITSSSGTWRQIDGYQIASNVYTLRTAGTTITLTAADRIMVPCEGFLAIRFTRAAGTSATFTVRTGGSMIEELTQLVISGGLTVTSTSSSGKTILTASGSLTADTDVIAAVTSKRIKVHAFSLYTFGTSASVILFKSNGVAGTLLWTACAQAVSSTVFGTGQSVNPPDFLFATTAGQKLTIDVGNTDTIYYSISYQADDAT